MRRLVVAGKLLLGLGLLAWLVVSGRLDFAALAGGSSPAVHLLGVTLALGSMLIQVVRWWRLLAVQGIVVPFGRVLRFNWIGYFYALVLPGMGGGDVLRGVYVVREATGARLKAVSTVVVDRLLGLYAFLFLGMLSLAASGDAGAAAARPLQALVAGLFCAATVAAGTVLWPWTRALLVRFVPGGVASRIADIIAQYGKDGRAMAVCGFLSLVAAAMLVVAFAVAAHAVGVALSPAQVLLVVPLVFIANSLPVAPGGIGVGETASAVLLAGFGIPGGATVMLTLRLWQAVTRLPGLVLHLAGGGRSTATIGASGEAPAVWSSPEERR